ncbi:MAG: hypothetical protein ACYDD2_06875 [Candidatus Acidiferrales bacterium]
MVRMQRLLTLFLVILFIVTASAGLNADGRTAQPDSHTQRSKKTDVGGCPVLREFKLIGIGDGGLSADGKTRLSITSYKAPDGTFLVKFFGDSDSPSAATAELEGWVKLASKIIVNSWKRDSQGHVVGRRVEALMPKKGSKDLVFAILWTSGHYFYQVSSSPRCKRAVFEAEENIRESK